MELDFSIIGVYIIVPISAIVRDAEPCILKFSDAGDFSHYFLVYPALYGPNYSFLLLGIVTALKYPRTYIFPSFMSKRIPSLNI